MAAKPHEPRMKEVRAWIDMLKAAISEDDRAAIKSVLLDAVPEFKQQAASGEARSG